MFGGVGCGISIDTLRPMTSSPGTEHRSAAGLKDSMRPAIDQDDGVDRGLDDRAPARLTAAQCAFGTPLRVMSRAVSTARTLPSRHESASRQRDFIRWPPVGQSDGVAARPPCRTGAPSSRHIPATGRPARA